MVIRPLLFSYGHTTIAFQLWSYDHCFSVMVIRPLLFSYMLHCAISACSSSAESAFLYFAAFPFTRASHSPQLWCVSTRPSTKLTYEYAFAFCRFLDSRLSLVACLSS